MYSDEGKELVTLPLMTSYRSSPEITEMFAGVLPKEKEMQVSSVKRPGEKVIIKACGSDKEYFSELEKLIKSFSKKDGLTAIICRSPLNLEKIIAFLGEKAPAIITGHESLPKSGAFLIELALAKGLEFDQVILADADAATYPDDELGKHCLYTAMSRATMHLAVLANGELASNVIVD
jgi:DNA helicase-2/ATP-dependent DNA helicase PcrA